MISCQSYHQKQEHHLVIYRKKKMSLYDKEIESYFLPYLQQSINITINDKPLKSGKLLLFKHDEYHIHLSLQDIKTEKIRNFEMPFPFKVEYWKNENILFLDYRNQSLTKNKQICDAIDNEFNKLNMKNRFYNKILVITNQEKK